MKFLAVALGAVIGAWLRWGVSSLLNPAHSHIPFGTLTVNLVGGFLIGLALAFIKSMPEMLSDNWRLASLFFITGFCGALTTFSTFSAESMNLIQKGEYLWAFGHSFAHLAGALICCFAGFAVYRIFAS